MTITRKELYAALIVAILLAVGGALALSAYISSGKDVTRFQQVQQDQKPIHEEAQQQVKNATDDKDATAKALAVALSQIAQQKQAPVDYDRIRDMIRAELPGMDVKVEGAKDAKGNALPDAPSSITVSGVGAAAKVNDALLGCKESNAKVGACEKMLADTEVQYLGEKKDHAATKAELETAKKAIKGGSFFSRLKSNAKFLVIGTAAGAGAVLATRR